MDTAPLSVNGGVSQTNETDRLTLVRKEEKMFILFAEIKKNRGEESRQILYTMTINDSIKSKMYTDVKKKLKIGAFAGH